jgi:hypothetical protein
MDFEKIFTNTSDSMKIEFLKSIISKNSEMQKAFSNFAGPSDNTKPTITDKQFKDLIEQTKMEYTESFEAVDLENPDWDDYTPSRSGYIEEWEQYQDAGEQEFQEIFQDFYDDALDTIIRQKTDELLAMLIGLHKATQSAEVHDEYESFGDVKEFLLSEHTKVVKKIVEKLQLSAVSEQAVLRTYTLFFNFTGSGETAANQYAHCFEDFLMALAEKTKNPEQLLSIINQSAVETSAIPRLILLLNQNSGNSGNWLATARQHYRQNNDVAMQLLKYNHKNDHHAFIQLANELYGANKNFWAPILKDYITPENDQHLFVEVFFTLTIQKNSIDDYNKLRPYLTPEKLEALIAELKEKLWDKQFLAKILAAENRHADIKKHIETNTFDWQKTKIMRFILEAYPEFCFNKIKNIVQKMLENQRGRHIYRQVTEWLQLADDIPGFKAENRTLARTLYNHKPNLPALRDELKQGGLV